MSPGTSLQVQHASASMELLVQAAWQVHQPEWMGGWPACSLLQAWENIRGWTQLLLSARKESCPDE